MEHNYTITYINKRYLCCIVFSTLGLHLGFSDLFYFYFNQYEKRDRNIKISKNMKRFLNEFTIYTKHPSTPRILIERLHATLCILETLEGENMYLISLPFYF